MFSGHSVQAVEPPASAYLPAAQLVQLVASAAEYVPMGQGVQEIEPAVENVPAAHGLDEWPLDKSLAKHLLRSSEAAQVDGQ